MTNGKRTKKKTSEEMHSREIPENSKWIKMQAAAAGKLSHGRLKVM